jgi:pimeloyl-ACP methyl ester carboxylesterase
VQLAEHRLPGLLVADHAFELPLDHASPGGERIEVFAREVAALDGRDRPWLVYFQGGPGHEAPRPEPKSPDWLSRALEDFRVLLLDQRGTGRSTPVTHETLAGRSPQEQADYLRHFRADGIVRDAEAIRAELGSDSWSVLGQSFGGFCVTCYLSLAPEGLREALITGGLPALDQDAQAIYRATYRRVLDKNRAFYERYPGDRDRVRALLERIRSEDVRLPEGDRLTVPRFRSLGHALGMGDGFEHLHYLLERPFGYGQLKAFQDELPFVTNPIYALLHEAEYVDSGPSRWGAERVLAELPEFEDETIFTGEMVYPWLFEDVELLRPLREAADLLAEAEDWPKLYDAARLRENEVPAAAAIYAEDMYVEREFSEQTAATIRGLKPWLTNAYEHNGLRVDGGRILGRLLALARGENPSG